jgi:phosphoribosylanthranilate isomerase
MYVKVCGITRLDDALEAIAAGADVLGFNCVPASKRYLDGPEIRTISDELRRLAPGKALCVAVVADLSPSRARSLLAELGVDRLQLHGDEPAEDIAALAPFAFKALRIGSAADVARAMGYPGHPLLVDAKVEGQRGGTGQRIDWPLVEPLARARPLILAGGLTPENVAQAVDAVRPWAVDVASGVEREGDPRRKDADKVLRFVLAARGATRASAINSGAGNTAMRAEHSAVF